MGMLHFDYLSQTLGYHTNIYFILPACTHEGKAPAATLYLLHGGGGNGMDWIRYTSIERYADKYNIAVVMPEVDGSCFYADMKHGYNYFTYLTEEVVAVAEGLLPVNKEPEKRLVAGLSMGGMQTQKIVFANPDLFASAGLFSGGLVIKNEEDDYSEVLLNPENFAKQFKLFFVSCGTKEGMVDAVKAGAEQIANAGVPIELYIDYGYHDWTFWRHCANQFLRKLFV